MLTRPLSQDLATATILLGRGKNPADPGLFISHLARGLVASAGVAADRQR